MVKATLIRQEDTQKLTHSHSDKGKKKKKKKKKRNQKITNNQINKQVHKLTQTLKTRIVKIQNQKHKKTAI